MKTYFAGFSNPHKAVKVLRSPKPKIYNQTSILEFFPVVKPVEEPEEEEDDSFIVDDEPLELFEEETSFIGPNVFEEDESDKEEEQTGGMHKDFEDFVAEVLFFKKEDGSFDEQKYLEFMSCPICDDCSFKLENINKVEI